MKIYYHPVSTTSRPLMLFAAESGIDVEFQLVDLMTGEHLKPAYAAINPNCLVPMLEDGDFRLTESSAILKYLADKTGSPAYPTDLRKRARVNEMMDWFNSNFYRDFSYGLIYPQVFPNHRRPTDEQQAGTISWGKEKAKRWLQILDENLIGPRNAYLCGDRITIADYLGAPMLTLGEVIRCDFAAYPNVRRWLGNMKALKSWNKVNEAFYGLLGAFKEMTFETI
ncbi:MAG: glutathione S-transferase [Betaproteobacteria bacterium RIFCSPLOWO2_12_FULL_62_58]|nr:MAG: glutathione S-transferase [Betaproteobacteria bacterium RIFCSPLOWO2_02_FULL_62_79]OGA55806.1 MAG: glutathione S-transferase [Betaproteobacteria bacterium RIFCSPLOWO2_12_FULL_62_58]